MPTILNEGELFMMIQSNILGLPYPRNPQAVADMAAWMAKTIVKMQEEALAEWMAADLEPVNEEAYYDWLEAEDNRTISIEEADHARRATYYDDTNDRDDEDLDDDEDAFYSDSVEEAYGKVSLIYDDDDDDSEWTDEDDEDIFDDDDDDDIATAFWETKIDEN